MVTIARLRAAIEFLIKGHPQALKVLTGDIEPPTSADILQIYQMIHASPEDLGLRVDSSSISRPQEEAISMAEQYQGIITEAGGWDQIVAVVKDFRHLRNMEWKLFCAHVTYVEGVRQHTSGSILDKLLDRYGVSPKTIQCKRREIPYEIAKAALLMPTGLI